MATPFAYNTVTTDGAALIAQATAANPIVIVGAKSCTLAAQDNADLASKPLSWYDGKSGTIAAVSATNAVARIVAKYTNSGTAQTAKSFCITARLASQSDDQAVVLTAKSDPDAAVFLPGADDVSMIVNIQHSIAINSSGTVEVTPGASASVEDLERFVSIHKAGDPTTGDVQTILGQKTFKGAIKVGTVQDSGEDVGYRMILACGNVSVGSPVFLIAGFDDTANVNNIQIGDMNSTWTINGNTICGGGVSSRIGKSGEKIKNIYVEDLNADRVHGILPSFSTGTTPEVGMIALLAILSTENITYYPVGTDVIDGTQQTISSVTGTPEIRFAIFSGSGELTNSGSDEVPTGSTWRVLTSGYSAYNGTLAKYKAIVLAMRVA